MQARMARYTYTGDVDELARRAEDGILPILRTQPGFKAYSVMSSNDEIISFSAWESEADAEAANATVAGWVAENVPGELHLKE